MKNILFVSLPFAGHTTQLSVLASEMARRGYSVSFATGKNLQEMLSCQGIKFFEWDANTTSLDHSILERYYNLWKKASREELTIRADAMMLDLMADAYPAMYLALKSIFDVQKPDLVVCDGMSFPGIDLAYKAEIPCVVATRFLDVYAPTGASHPHFGTDYLMSMTFKERVLNCLYPLRAFLYLRKPLKKLKRARKKFNLTENLSNIEKKCLILVFSTFGFELPRAIPPHIQLVGPLIPVEPPSISEGLKTWLDSYKKEGVIYIAFGTLATIEKWQAHVLAAGLLDLQIPVLWSLPENQQSLLPPLPPHFRIESFVAQQTILAHPAVRIFITHCGANGIHESFYFGKPMLGLPFFGDQPYNAARLVDLGVGLRLDKRNFTSEEVREKVNLLIKEKSFTDVAQKLAIIQRSCNALDRAANLLECASKVGIETFIP